MQNLNYVVYKTTNLITGQEYIGMFSYNPEEKSGIYKSMTYIGAGITYDGQARLMKGSPFTRNVQKYGYDNFKREDLYVFNNAEEAYNKEAELCNWEYVNQKHVLNQKTGGRSGILCLAVRQQMSKNTTGAGNPKAIRVQALESGREYGCIKDALQEFPELTYQQLKYDVKNNNQKYLKQI